MSRKQKPQFPPPIGANRNIKPLKPTIAVANLFLAYNNYAIYARWEAVSKSWFFQINIYVYKSYLPVYQSETMCEAVQRSIQLETYMEDTGTSPDELVERYKDAVETDSFFDFLADWQPKPPPHPEEL